MKLGFTKVFVTGLFNLFALQCFPQSSSVFCILNFNVKMFVDLIVMCMFVVASLRVRVKA